MKFDFCIGNPPYQESYQGNSTGANSVYDKFIDAAYTVAKKTELIHPARFLFNAGSTSKSWNEKMLNDEHLKVMEYEEDASKIFPNTEIKGGVAITYHDDKKNYGAIEIFTPFTELNSILHKVIADKDYKPISEICVSSSAYHFTEELHEDFQDLKKRKIIVKGKEQPLLSKGHEYDLKSSIFEKIPEVFLDEPNSDDEYIQILGRDSDGRSKKYIKKKYVGYVKNLDKYKIFLPKASGNGQFGETLTAPSVEQPNVGATETFYSIGLCDDEKEINYILKYIKTKFARALLSVLKITQDVNPGKWKYVPLQDFTDNSDIDWKEKISSIDHQLYRKYGLSENEIDFIETNVKEME
ncbi:MAG: Eco57I restriction-modification methylase domain-containing protein [Lachnospiraceae bacterium]|nr:Eco57I restriction-modification methylase domain-containing protein [Lachnospiraceae bacterium]